MDSRSKIIILKKKLHEAGYLSLDSLKSKKLLNWQKFLNLDQTLKFIVDWFYDYKKNKNMREICKKQIKIFYKDYKW